jgi:hypothetical protein
MVGTPGARIQNPSPPSTALLAFGLAQCGVAIALEPTVKRWLGRHRSARSAVDLGGALTMPVYLWHMVPVVGLVAAGYLSVVGRPAVGSAVWWAERPVWIALLSVGLAAVLAVLALATRFIRFVGSRCRDRGGARAERRRHRPGPRCATALLVAGVAVASVGVARLAIGGFAPDGSLAPVPLVGLALGLALVSGAQLPSVARPANRTGRPHAYGDT